MYRYVYKYTHQYDHINSLWLAFVPRMSYQFNKLNRSEGSPHGSAHLLIVLRITPAKSR